MKIAFWTTASLEPRYEAVSQEVLSLCQAFPRSWIFATNPHCIVRLLPRTRCVGLHPSFYPVMRAIVPLVERAFHLSHVYGDMTPWLFHKTLRRRPIVHTVTQDCPTPAVEFLKRASAVVLQTRATYDRVLTLGIEPGRVHLRFPSVDLDAFTPATGTAPSVTSPRILFATAPRTAEEMLGRGVFLLLDAAAAFPELHFRLLYRTWSSGYSSLQPTRQGIAERALGNVELTDGVVSNMAAVYRSYDFTVIPYTTPAGGKECPNSALESLACGVPALVSSACTFSRFVLENRCGCVFEPTPRGLRSAVDEGLRNWKAFSCAARAAAIEHFDAAKLLCLRDLCPTLRIGRRLARFLELFMTLWFSSRQKS